MRIGLLQFAPQLGDIDNNLNRADAVLNKANPEEVRSLDIILLPELAFSGSNFKSMSEIEPCLEPTNAGITQLWARLTALKYDCVVAVGYPEREMKSLRVYNSVLMMDRNGDILINHSRSVLAPEQPDPSYWVDWKGKVGMGFCRLPQDDVPALNFEESHIRFIPEHKKLLVVSIAFSITEDTEDARKFGISPEDPDLRMLDSCLTVMQDIIRANQKDEIIVMIANRAGTEGDVTYAGTSAVFGIQGHSVKIYGLLGRGEKRLLVVDTEKGYKAKLIYFEGAKGDKAELIYSEEPKVKLSSGHTGLANPRLDLDTIERPEDPKSRNLASRHGPERNRPLRSQSCPGRLVGRNL